MFSHCGFNLNAFDYYWDYTHHWPVIPLVLLLRIHSLQTLRMAYFDWFVTVILFICEQVYGGTRGQPWVSFLKRHHLPCFLRWDLSPSESSLVRLDWLASELQGSTSLHLAALGLEACTTSMPHLFTWDQTQVLMLSQQVLCQLNNLPSLPEFFIFQMLNCYMCFKYVNSGFPFLICETFNRDV